VALGKLLTLVCLCRQAVQSGTGQEGWSFWLGSNRRSGGKKLKNL